MFAFLSFFFMFSFRSNDQRPPSKMSCCSKTQPRLACQLVKVFIQRVTSEKSKKKSQSYCLLFSSPNLIIPRRLRSFSSHSHCALVYIFVSNGTNEINSPNRRSIDGWTITDRTAAASENTKQVLCLTFHTPKFSINTILILFQFSLMMINSRRRLFPPNCSPPFAWTINLTPISNKYFKVSNYDFDCD